MQKHARVMNNSNINFRKPWNCTEDKT